jgi:hypothetical protein
MRFSEFHKIILKAVLLLLLLLLFVAIRPAAGHVAADLNLSAQSPSAIPPDPPRADKISFSPLNELGEATVTGAPGAVLPNAHVLLINLNSAHQDHVISGPDGSFSAQIFAPPGSAIMVKHGPDHKFWHIDPWADIDQGGQGFLTIFSSTTIYRPYEHSVAPGALPFAAAGGIDVSEEPKPSTVGAAWSMAGAVSPADNLHPGDAVHVQADIRLYSQAIISTTDVSTITLQIDPMSPWLMLFDEAGKPLPYMNQAGSNRLTPTGFPILDANRPDVHSTVTWDPVNWKYMGGHMLSGSLTLTMTLAADMPPGVYRPILNMEFDGVPSGSDWRAALLSWMAGWPHFAFSSTGAALPPLEVNAPAPAPGVSQDRHLIWYLQMDNASLGTRGTGAIQDRELFQPSSFVVTQGAPYVLAPRDPFSGDPAVYRLEPYLPLISYGRGASPGPPLIPFKLPGGQLCVIIHEPDGAQQDLGCSSFAQSRSGDKATAGGELLNLGAIEVSEYYGLTTASDQFAVAFTKPGHHVIEMNGWVEDGWGNRYAGGGDYEVWVASPIDIDPGLLPGTPLATGEAINPTVQLNPRLPAYVNLTIQHFPYSDPNLMQVYTIEGWANRFGYFATDDPPVTLNEPGEYRLDLFAQYLDPISGEMSVGAATWGGVVMTPPANAQLVAHGRRGSDNFSQIPSQWFAFCDQNLDPPLVKGSTPHLLNSYLNGDILWSYDRVPPNSPPECLGNALMMNVGIQDTVGTVEAAITERYNRNPLPVASPGNFVQRAQVDALPLFSSTTSGRAVSLVPEETDQIGYAYLASERPGVRVRESVAEDHQGSGYWRLDGMYDNQPGVGVEGDLPNDFKFQYVGAVYRDLTNGLSEYLGQGSGWVHLPYSDTVGSRVMPPFSGQGNGGWPTTGGPLMTLKGKDIQMFILPTGVRPGAVLQVGERFNFAGHIMPTLNSQVQVEVTSPSGQRYVMGGRANKIGYFYDPAGSFVVDEPGRWVAKVQVWHDGQIGSGAQVDCDPAAPFDPLRPCPTGDVLGSAGGSYAFYVVSPDAPRLILTDPVPGRLFFGDQVDPINISGPIPFGVSNATVDYTISMPGFILKEGQAQIVNGEFSLSFDPQALHADFPNLDLTGRYTKDAGLADTFSFGLLLTGQQGGQKVNMATTLTIQGDQVYVENGEDVVIPSNLFLPLALLNEP